MLIQHVTGRAVGSGAQAQGLCLALAAQIQVAVLQAGLLAYLARGGRIIYLEGQRCGFVEHLQVGDVDLDVSGRQVRVFGAFWARLHHAGYLDAVFRTQVVGALCHIGFAEDHLGDAGTIAQVDEDHAAVITATRNPTG